MVTIIIFFGLTGGGRVGLERMSAEMAGGDYVSCKFGMGFFDTAGRKD